MEPMAASELLIARSSVAVVIMVACPAPFSVPRSICDRHEDAEHREACNSSQIILQWDSSAYFPNSSWEKWAIAWLPIQTFKISNF